MQIQGIYPESGAVTYNSAAVEENRQIASGAGKLFSLVVANYTNAIRYVWLFDSLSSAGVPLCPPIPLAVGGAIGSIVSLGGSSAAFGTGLRVASSTTGATFTASTTADLRINAVYKN